MDRDAVHFAIPGNGDSHRLAAKAEYIQVIVLDTLTSGKVIRAERGADAHHSVCGNGGTQSAAADQDAALAACRFRDAGARMPRKSLYMHVDESSAKMAV
jgi:hypothetical protein